MTNPPEIRVPLKLSLPIGCDWSGCEIWNSVYCTR